LINKRRAVTSVMTWFFLVCVDMYYNSPTRLLVQRISFGYEADLHMTTYNWLMQPLRHTRSKQT